LSKTNARKIIPKINSSKIKNLLLTIRNGKKLFIFQKFFSENLKEQKIHSLKSKREKNSLPDNFLLKAANTKKRKKVRSLRSLDNPQRGHVNYGKLALPIAGDDLSVLIKSGIERLLVCLVISCFRWVFWEKIVLVFCAFWDKMKIVMVLYGL
jgi:hypothetical protein